MRTYVLTVIEPDTEISKGQFGLHEEDADYVFEGVVRCGLNDALFWIETMEKNHE